MASSFVEYKDNGFWARDGFVKAFQLLLFEEINDQYKDEVNWLNEYKKQLALQSLPLIYGGMSMLLNETLIDKERENIILYLLQNIERKIKTDESYLTGNHLNELKKVVRYYLIEMKEIELSEKELERNLKDEKYGEKLPTENYQYAFDLLSKLIRGELYFKVDTPITYWGK